jgi:hypothetical protein
MCNFLDDWCLENDCIINENRGLFMIIAPSCIIMTAKELNSIEL